MIEMRLNFTVRASNMTSLAAAAYARAHSLAGDGWKLRSSYGVQARYHAEQVEKVVRTYTDTDPYEVEGEFTAIYIRDDA